MGYHVVIEPSARDSVPLFKISSPACTASGWAVATIPLCGQTPELFALHKENCYNQTFACPHPMITFTNNGRFISFRRIFLLVMFTSERKALDYISDQTTDSICNLRLITGLTEFPQNAQKGCPLPVIWRRTACYHYFSHQLLCRVLGTLVNG